MERWVGKVAIVTGASSGIGAETAEALVLAGVKVAGLARRVEKVREIATKLEGQKGRLYPIECDLRKEEDILKAFQWVEEELGGVDILVNNAGVLCVEPIIDGSTEDFRKLLDVNVLALAICAREAVKSMRKRGGAGHIIVVNSIMGHSVAYFPKPMSLYPTSKYAVTGMVQSLRVEMAAANLNIKVTSVSPGLVNTEMPASVGYTEELLNSPVSLQCKDIADAIMYALATPPNVQVWELTVTPVGKAVEPTDSK